MNFHPHAFPHLVHPEPPTQSSYERELAAIAARSARRTPRPKLLARFALRRLFAGPAVTDGAVTIRHATDADRNALTRMAVAEGKPLPGGPALVAQVGGRVVAGLPLETEEPIADPFRARRDVVQLLHVRAAQLAAA